VELRERWIIVAFLALVILTIVGAIQPQRTVLSDKFFTLFDLLETVIEDKPSAGNPFQLVEVTGTYPTKFEETEKGKD